LGSRGTSHAFPFGALAFASTDANAARVGASQLRGLARRVVPGPATVDDRYFAYFHLPHFALALFQASMNSVTLADVAAPSDNFVDLPASGIIVARRSDWSVTISRRLGSAVAVQTTEQPALYHLGYEVTLGGGARYSSANWDSTLDPPLCVAGARLEATARFTAVSSGLPLRKLMVPFQVVLYLLRSSSAAQAFQALIKRKMIAPRANLALRLERRIETTAGAVRIEDTLVPQAGLPAVERLAVANTISMHSPSA